MEFYKSLTAIVVAFALAPADRAQAQPLPPATPESVGFSTQRLQNIDTFLPAKSNVSEYRVRLLQSLATES